MAISAKDVAALRKETGAGMMDCKAALNESNGDYEGALDYLRKKGQKVAAKRADREANEGVVVTESSDGAAIVMALSCETDFVARNEDFVAFAKSISGLAMEKGATTKDELLQLELDGMTVEQKLVERTGTVGEKMEISDFQRVEGEKIASYIHAGAKIGVLVSYADGGKGDEAAGFFRSVAMHIAAMKPSILRPDEFDPAFVAKETEALQAQIRAENELNEKENLGKPIKPVPQFGSRLQLTEEAIAKAEADIKAELEAAGKPEKIWDKIVPGKLQRFIEDNSQLDTEHCLLSQPFALDDSKTVEAAVTDFAAEAAVVAFRRVAVG